MSSSELSSDEQNEQVLGNKQTNTCSYQTDRWVMVWNNYPSDVEVRLKNLIPFCSKYVFGYEIGDEGTEHIQGAFMLKKKWRQGQIFNLLEAEMWLDKMKGKWIHQAYCKKDGHFITSDLPPYTKEIECMYPWQQDIINIIKSEPDERTIYWFWEAEGCRGKTTIQKYIHSHFNNVVVLSGKGSDMKNGIVQMKELPKVILINIPRSNLDYVSYTGIEEVKDMFFFSGKYEGGMVNGPEPHVLIFANEEPKYETMSRDRWVVREI